MSETPANDCNPNAVESRECLQETANLNAIEYWRNVTNREECRERMMEYESGRVRWFDGDCKDVDNRTLHLNVKCNACKSKIGNSRRWKCTTCAGFNLCGSCARAGADEQHFHGAHAFVEVKDSRPPMRTQK